MNLEHSASIAFMANKHTQNLEYLRTVPLIYLQIPYISSSIYDFST